MASGLKQTDLLYVTNANGFVNVYSYSQHTLEGILTNFDAPYGECADFSGNVYITDVANKNISEYAHGASKPTRVISESSADTPYGCALSSSNGDLAIVNFNSEYTPGTVAVYPHGSGQPTIYKGLSTDEFVYGAYDGNGDLFVVGRYYYYYYFFWYYDFYYLPKGGSSLISMSISGPSSSGRWSEIQGIAWDGKYWVIDSDDTLYRYTIDVKATLVGKVTLSGGSNSGPLAILRTTPKSAGTQVVGAAATSTGGTVYYWNYPSGGDSIGTISKYLDAPYGTAISL